MKAIGLSVPLGGFGPSLPDRFRNLLPYGLDRLLAGLRSESQLLGPQKGNVRDAHEPEQVAKVRFLRVHRLLGSLAVQPSPALDHNGTLFLKQTLRAALAITECDASPQHMVEPGLQGRWYSEIV